jgi:diacylglycerol kinase (ATP)
MRTRVVVNPDAGAGRAAARARAARPKLEAAFGPLDWRESRSAEHLTELVAEVAREGAPSVLVAGGDGAVHFAAAALAGSETALGILPVGTGNDVAASVGVPKDLDAAAEVLARGHVRAIDLGEVNGRAYVCVLGVGMDTAALEWINAARFLARGRLLYTLAALRTLLTYRAPEVEIAWSLGAPSETRWGGRLVFAAVTNTKSYAGGMKITPAADVEDGALDLCVIPQLGLPRLLASFGRVLDGRHAGMKGIVLARSEDVHIASEVPLPVTLDGELTDLTTPVVARVLPGALRVLGAPVATVRRVATQELLRSA